MAEKDNLTTWWFEKVMIALVVVLLAGKPVPAAAQRVILDCDPAIGTNVRFAEVSEPRLAQLRRQFAGQVAVTEVLDAIAKNLINRSVPNDVDDGLAIIYLLNSPGVSVEGITLGHGNRDPLGARSDPDGLQTITACAREVVRVWQNQHPGARGPGIYAGARSANCFSPTGECIPTPASCFMSNIARNSPGGVDIICIGTLTNIATAMRTDPEFAANVGTIYIVGGAVNRPAIVPGILCPERSDLWSEFNVWRDPVAAEYVFSHARDLVLIPLDCTERFVFDRALLGELRQRNTPVAGYVCRRTEPWLTLNETIQIKARILDGAVGGGFFPVDLVGVAAAIDRSGVVARATAGTRITLLRPSSARASGGIDRELQVGHTWLIPGGGNTTVYWDINQNTLRERILDRLR